MGRIEFVEKKCTACGACAVACMDLNDPEISEGQQPYRRVFEREENGRVRCLSVSCLHCPDPPCADACPMGCIRRDEGTGLVLYDSADCIGCRACHDVCPVGAPTFRPSAGDRMEKCHGCAARRKAGLFPACVQVCPTGALRYITE